jgi:hypothetical protein
MQALAGATSEQATSTEEISHSMRHVRSRTREIATALGAQAKSATASAIDVEVVAREIVALRLANGEQSVLVADIARAGPA